MSSPATSSSAASSPTTKQERIVGVLQKVIRALKNVPHFVFYGTMLGWRREGTVIEHDDDADVMIDIAYRSTVDTIVADMMRTDTGDGYGEKSLFAVRRPNLIQLADVPRPNLDKNPLAACVDIYFYTLKNSGGASTAAYGDGIVLWDTWNRWRFKSTDVFPLRPIEFVGCSTFVAKEHDTILANLYGPDYMVPIKNKKYKPQNKGKDKYADTWLEK